MASASRGLPLTCRMVGHDWLPCSGHDGISAQNYAICRRCAAVSVRPRLIDGHLGRHVRAVSDYPARHLRQR